MNTYALAALLVEQQRPLVIDEIKLPSNLDIGQVLVELEYSGICGSQIGEINGVKGPDPFLPHLLGHEGSGRVSEIGPGVTTVKVGDKVVLHWRKGTGIEAAVPKYSWDGKIVNAGCVTTFNSRAIISENRLTKIDDALDSKVAALFGCAITTGFGVVVNDAKLKIGENILVLGAGGVGLNVIQGAKLAGANKIIAVDLWDNRLKLSADFGATDIINAKKVKNLKSEIYNKLENNFLNVVVDNTGSPDMIKLAYEAIASDGRVILVGVPKKGNETSLYTLPMHFGKQLIGSEGGGSVPQIDIPRYSGLLKNGKFEFENLISSIVGLAEVNGAIENMINGNEAGRILIKME